MFNRILWSTAILVVAFSIAPSHQKPSSNDIQAAHQKLSSDGLGIQTLQQLKEYVDSKFANILQEFANILQGLNECNSYNGGCQHECKDTKGSFLCSCYPGYELANDTKSCIGLQTCSEADGFIQPHNSTKCFKTLTRKKLNWEVAKDQCEIRGLALAEVDPEDTLELRKLLNRKNGNKDYWVGAKGTNSGVQWEKGGRHIYPNRTMVNEDGEAKSVWVSGWPHERNYNKGQCLGIKATKYDLEHSPSASYWTSGCWTTVGYPLCEVIF